ncbi:uncharacterized protein Z520_06019 [Fonsecaea multimorphosa CBS 102226]|uniref:C2H2-type domain-containing protein n=1 Tax=Fonsecaea multimorphosa CBS 102226 TaxID=1442371 RepID=A0A0D2ILS4_9EURO|nr:uncharacterized protein Z520_06019 [Fonsecaea multimorphosa CBS 102226]KIX97941.1 hypothetical protein Z520_06019 [Fonsecaea multimorphosa CBS 102226]OAL24314.1 hypothetical protein AYO22_05690 [Fonsecaea multimorphosa]
MERIHDQLPDHACSTNCSAAEYVPIVLNHCSSNCNIAQATKTQEIAKLRKTLDLLEARGDARQSRVIIAMSGVDGFCTNIDGLHEFFRVYVNIVITFIVFHGKDQHQVYSAKELLSAIQDIKAQTIISESPSHLFVLRMISVAVGKEKHADSNRDLQRMLTERRNSEWVPYEIKRPTEPTEIEAVTFTLPPEQAGVILRYGLERNDKGQFICPNQPCATNCNTIDNIIIHLISHCRIQSKCVLCPIGLLNDFSTGNFKDSPNSAFVISLKQHLLHHLPPTYFCMHEGCNRSYHTSDELKRHRAYHKTSNDEMVPCPNCGKLQKKKSLSRHMGLCSADESTKQLHQCGTCNGVFPNAAKLNNHIRNAHQRRDEIIGIAVSSGLLNAGVPGLGLDASAAVQGAVDNIQSAQTQEHGNTVSKVEIWPPKAKANGLRTSDPVRTLFPGN